MNPPFIVIPNLRRECSMCYQLLYFTYWEYNTNIEHKYVIGSNTGFLGMINPTLTVKAYCLNCHMEITREYRDMNGRLILSSEQIFQDSPYLHNGLYHV